MSEAKRKLMPEGSHAEAPERQVQKVDEAASAPIPADKENSTESISFENMFKLMMQKMDKVETTVGGMAAKVDGAVQAANDAKVSVKQLEANIDEEQESRKVWQEEIEGGSRR